MTTVSNDEYDAYTDKPKASSDKLSQLIGLADQHTVAAAALAKAEDDVEVRKKRVKDLVENQIPALMDEIGLAEFKLPSGLVVTVEEIIRASILADNLQRALVWLRANGHSAIIKNTVSLDFSKGEDEKARDLIKKLSELGFTPEQKESVNFQTLQSFAKEKLKKGEELPDDSFSIHRQRVASIDVPTAPKKRK